MGRIQVPPDHLRKVAQKFHNEHVRLSDELNRLNTSLSSVMLGLEGHSVERFRYEYREAENRMNMILAVIQNTAKELERIVILFTDADSGEVHLPDTPRKHGGC
ncbi:WXG100 family type VII secretion target [Paenibacillus sp. CC-CFT742]|nr:WXG100 family type VII secretion target [Paenibacillus sp. CC-CFT742]WJH31210.1 WXG100 family type VII secretion target [Paenibacillus sp. CC-CFT742]